MKQLHVSSTGTSGELCIKNNRFKEGKADDHLSCSLTEKKKMRKETRKSIIKMQTKLARQEKKYKTKLEGKGNKNIGQSINALVPLSENTSGKEN